VGVVVALQLATVAEGEIEPTQMDVGIPFNVTVGFDFTVIVRHSPPDLLQPN